MKKLSLLFVLTTLTLLLTACVGSQEDNAKETDGGANGDTRTFKLAHIVQETHVWHDTAEKFGEELEALSDGRLNLEIYPAGQLGAEADMVQQIETGAIDFGFMTNAYMSTREESLNAWFMPYLFNNIENATAMRDSDTTKDILATLDSQGFIGLDFIFAGNRHVLSSKAFAATPADLKGQKIRIIGSPAMQSYWQKVGAAPTAMPLPEVYQSLQTGVIDGIDIDLDALVTEKFYENAKYLTLTNQMTFPSVAIMGQTTFNDLSSEDQEIVKTAMKNAANWGAQQAVEREKSNLQALKDAGVDVMENVDAAAYADVTKQVRDEFSTKSELIKSFIEAAESK